MQADPMLEAEPYQGSDHPPHPSHVVRHEQNGQEGRLADTGSHRPRQNRPRRDLRANSGRGRVREDAGKRP